MYLNALAFLIILSPSLVKLKGHTTQDEICSKHDPKQKLEKEDMKK